MLPLPSGGLEAVVHQSKALVQLQSSGMILPHATSQVVLIHRLGADAVLVRRLASAAMSGSDPLTARRECHERNTVDFCISDCAACMSQVLPRRAELNARNSSGFRKMSTCPRGQTEQRGPGVSVLVPGCRSSISSPTPDGQTERRSQPRRPRAARSPPRASIRDDRGRCCRRRRGACPARRAASCRGAWGADRSRR